MTDCKVSRYRADRPTRSAVLKLLVAVIAVISFSALAEQTLQPEIGITLRNALDGIVEQGEPVRIAALIRIEDSDGYPGELVLAPLSATWVDAINVELLSADSQTVVLIALSLGPPDDPIATLSPFRSAGGLWRMTSQQTAMLTPGAYLLRARLVIRAAAPGSNGWTGEVFSQIIPLTIVTPSDNPERRSQTAIAIAQDAILDGRLEDAARTIDALLTDQPENIGAWTVRAVISERAGNIPGAMLSLNRARRLYFGDDYRSNPVEPNVELEMIQGRLMSALLAAEPASGAASAAPAWSWPPAKLVIPEPGRAPAPSSQQPATESTITADSTAVTIVDSTGNPKSTDVPPSLPSTPVDRVTVVASADISEAAIIADRRGQWASTARASSEYGKDRYTAMQATGAPNVASYSDNPNAWCHSGASVPSEWLELGFADPVHATELRVRQSFTPGTLAKVEAFSADGSGIVLWEGTDPNTYPPREISWFVLQFPATEFPVARIKLTLSVGRISGWKQIDAVQLVGDSS